MRGIDWDKVKRQRNLWKPDYREAFIRELKQLPIQAKVEPQNFVTSSSHFFSCPFKAGDIRSRLKARGLNGKALTDAVNDVMSGKRHLAWVEFEIEMEQLLSQGFEMGPSEVIGEKMFVSFRKNSKDKEIIEERRFTFVKSK
ncbi:MAG: hypothetical protein ACO1QB_16955 [Verrucomicrobiales bacterium]